MAGRLHPSRPTPDRIDSPLLMRVDVIVMVALTLFSMAVYDVP
jgi:hypothetical protein